MKACIIRQAGELALEERPDPVPAADEVLIRLGAGGICGSDLHYFKEGGVGNFKLRMPMILGHEAAGVVAGVGANISRVKIGDRVAVNPSQPCGECRSCRAGRRNLCSNVRFYGSAARFPHVDGVFSDFFLAREDNCHSIPATLPFPAAACAEPLAVVLHAATQAGSLLGRTVLVIGSGPIGVLMTAVARLGGAHRICVTDVLDEPLALARTMGATETINVLTQAERMNAYAAGPGTFDVVFEASGSPAGLATAIEVAVAGGTLVQIGMLPAGPTAAPLNRVIAKELRLLGSFRFDGEYLAAVDLLVQGRIAVAPLLTHQFKFSEVQEAFATAANKRQAMKVSLSPN